MLIFRFFLLAAVLPILLNHLELFDKLPHQGYRR
jgi:hypothetical protein